MSIGYLWCRQCQRKVAPVHEHPTDYIPPEVDELEQRITELEAENARFHEGLKKLEWIMPDASCGRVCPVCYAAVDRERHYDRCWLAELLK